MRREFIINIILLFIINLLIKPVYIFGIEARVQDLVGTESYGLYFFYFNFVFLFQFINDPGIQNWNAQYVPKNTGTVGIHFANLLQIKLLLGLIFIFLTWLTAFMSGYHDLNIVIYISFSFVLSSLFMIFRGVIAGIGYYRTDSLLSSLDKMLMIIILGYLVYFSSYKDHFNIRFLIIVQIVAYFIACCVAGFIIIQKIKPVFKSIRRSEFSNVIKSGAPFVLIMVFMTTYNKLDGVMLGLLLHDNNYQAGVYAAAYRFYDAANMVGYLFAALLLPMYASQINQSDVIKELVNTGLRYTGAISLVVVVSIWFYGDKILSLLYTEYQPQFFVTLKILMLSYFMVAVSYIYGTLLVATGKVRNLNVILAIGLLLNVILCLILIPAYKAIGASIATLITQSFVMIGQIYLVKREKGIVMSKNVMIRISAFGISIFFFFGLFSNFKGVEWYLNLGACILICVLLSFIFKIIDKQDISLLFNRKK